MPIELRDYVFANLARTTLAADVSASDTQFTIQTADTSLFPSADESLFIDDIYSIVIHGSNGEFEVCYCTAQSGDVLTVERGREDTTAQAFPAGTAIVHTVTRGFLEQVVAMRTGVAPSTPVLTGTDSDPDFQLDWTAATPASGDLIRGYNLYRQDNGAGGFILIATLDGDVLTYLDEDVDLSLNSYEWQVTAVGFLGGEGTASNIVEAGQPIFLPIMNDVTACNPVIDGAGTAVATNTIAGADLEVTCGTVTNKGFLPMPGIYPLPTTGKYYYEVRYTQLATRLNDGIGVRVMFGRTDYFTDTDNPIPDRYTWYDDYNGTTGGYLNDGDTSITIAAARLDLNDVVGVAIDFDNLKVWFSKNGTWQGPGTQDPATNQGGFWPTDLASVGVVGATPRPAFGPRFGLDFSTTATKLEGRFSEDYWTLTPPAGFIEIDYFRHETGMPSSGATIIDPLVVYNVHNFCPGLSMVIQNSLAAASDCVKHSLSKSSGKWYAELQVLGGSVFSGDFGLREASAASYNVVPGSGANDDIGCNEAGTVAPVIAPYLGTNWAGTGVDARASAATGYGDTLMMAVDLDNGKIFFGLNGVWFNSQDPTNPAHGAAIPGFPDTYEFLVCVASQPLLINTGGMLFHETIPAGYLPWGRS